MQTITAVTACQTDGTDDAIETVTLVVTFADGTKSALVFTAAAAEAAHDLLDSIGAIYDGLG